MTVKHMCTFASHLNNLHCPSTKWTDNCQLNARYSSILVRVGKARSQEPGTWIVLFLVKLKFRAESNVASINWVSRTGRTMQLAAETSLRLIFINRRTMLIDNWILRVKSHTGFHGMQDQMLTPGMPIVITAISMHYNCTINFLIKLVLLPIKY